MTPNRPTTEALLTKTRNRLQNLSPARLQVAADFVAYLEDRESDEATRELLAIPGFRESLRQAEEEIARGEITPLEEIRESSEMGNAY